MDYDSESRDNYEADPYVVENFLAHSERLTLGEVRTQILLCVDERASANGYLSDVSSDKHIYVNVPGAGIGFLSNDDILHILARSNGIIDIYAHRFCGWGALLFNEFLENNEENEDFSGHRRVIQSISQAVYDEEFCKMYNIEPGDEGELLDEAGLFITNKYNDLVLGRILEVDKEWEEFFQRAFVYGEALNLKNRIENYYQMVSAGGYPYLPEELNINVLIDPLEGAPHKHIANAAVINCTARSITSRFQVDGADAFFADVDDNNIQQVLDLIFKIMEGDHSDTSDTHHNAYVFCESEGQLKYLQGILQGLTGLNRNIFLYLIGD